MDQGSRTSTDPNPWIPIEMLFDETHEYGAEVGAPWYMLDIEVNVVAGPHSGSRAVIRAVIEGRTCILLAAGQEFEAVADEDFELLVPRRNDRVKIIRGELRGELGQLINIGVQPRLGLCCAPVSCDYDTVYDTAYSHTASKNLLWPFLS
jgi:hypothetical protein